jgi:hypothetical protein
MNSRISHGNDIKTIPGIFPWNSVSSVFYGRLLKDEFFESKVSSCWVDSPFTKNLIDQNLKYPALMAEICQNNEIETLGDTKKLTRATFENLLLQLRSGRPFDKDLYQQSADNTLALSVLAKTMSFDLMYVFFNQEDSVLDKLKEKPADIGSAEYRSIFNLLHYGKLHHVRDGIKYLLKVHPELGEITDTGYILNSEEDGWTTVLLIVKQLIRSFISGYSGIGNKEFNFDNAQIFDKGVDFTQTVAGIVDMEYCFSLVEPTADLEPEDLYNDCNDINIVKNNVKNFINICSGAEGADFSKFTEQLINLSSGPTAAAMGYFKKEVDGGNVNGNIHAGDDLSDLTPADLFLYNNSDMGRSLIEQSARDGTLDNIEAKHEEGSKGDLFILCDTTGSVLSSYSCGTPPLIYVLESIMLSLALSARNANRNTHVFFYDLGISATVTIPADCDEAEFKSLKSSLLGRARCLGNDETRAFELLFKELNMLHHNKEKSVIFMTDGGMLTDSINDTRNRYREADHLNKMLMRQRDVNNTEVVPLLFSTADQDSVVSRVFDGFPLVHIRNADDLHSGVIDDLIKLVDKTAVTESDLKVPKPPGFDDPGYFEGF